MDVIKKSRITSENYSIYTNIIENHNLYLTVSVTQKPENLNELVKKIYNKISEILIESSMSIVHERLFGSISVSTEVMLARKEVLNENKINYELATTYIQGQPVWGQGLSGIQIRAVSVESLDKNLWTIFENGKACGRGWKQNGNTFLMLQNIHGSVISQFGENNRKVETREMFDRAEKILKSEGATFHNVVRTWLYLDNILDWYDDFNLVRNQKFKELKLLPDSENGSIAEDIYMPASTGIEGYNPMRAVGVMDVFAVLPDNDYKKEICQTAGVKQKSPYRYKSAFSRAMAVYDKVMKQILVSGTASIDETGETVFLNDTKAQISKTFEVIEKLVTNEDAAMNDIYEATVFLKKENDLSYYKEIIEEYKLEDIPNVIMVADVCRNDLLFEMDASFVVKN